jgi:hypothetical protein
MIVFEFDYETHNSDGTLKLRPMYFLGTTNVVGKDKEHTDEIYEQLDAQACGLA